MQYYLRNKLDLLMLWSKNSFQRYTTAAICGILNSVVLILQII